MRRNVLAYLEQTAARLPDKVAVVEEGRRCSYQTLVTESQIIGSRLAEVLSPGQPVMVYMEKGIDALCAFFGVVYAGGCYTLANPELPAARLRQMQQVLDCKVVITYSGLADAASAQFAQATIYPLEQLQKAEVNAQALALARRRQIDADPLYVNFTSGSTGTPKGIAVSHRSVIDFIDEFTAAFAITEADVIANQAPFDFDVSVKDIYAAIKTGATLVIVPRRMFTAPVELIDYLCAQRVTTLIWAVSALCLISTFHGLDYQTPETVNKVLFSGEVMPYKHLCCWRQHLPKAMFVNLYGPTEITCNCTYHILSPNRDYAQGIPIGRPFANEDVFLLDENHRRITESQTVGEICVRGTALALGYYGAPEQTKAHFVQNPGNEKYPERIYRTGDLGKYDADGELVFCGRRDFQIKYRGHRLELEEIERAMAAIDGVERCCCIFQPDKAKLLGYYVGDVGKQSLYAAMKAKLPAFMLPGTLRQVDAMPLTKNGKIDRQALQKVR